jgi:hypothetical protein
MADIGAGEGPKPETLLQLSAMLQTGLASAALLGEGRRRRMNLIRQEAQYRRWNGLVGAQAKAWMAKQRQLHCGPQLVGRTLPSLNPFQVAG